MVKTLGGGVYMNDTGIKSHVFAFEQKKNFGPWDVILVKILKAN